MQQLRALLLMLPVVTVSAWAFKLPPVLRQMPSQQVRSQNCVRCGSIVALAKKKPKPRKRITKPPNTIQSAAPRPSSPPAASSVPPVRTSSAAPLEDRLDAVLRDAGVAPAQSDMVDSMKGSADPLSKIPKAGQELLERFFGGGAIVFGSAFLLSGLAVSIEAVCKVTGNSLPTAIDEVLVQYIEPAMTPSILILFFFSISLGLLKQLQLGSEQAGVLYTEDDD